VATSCSGSDVCDPAVDAASTAQASYPLGAASYACTVTDDTGNEMKS